MIAFSRATFGPGPRTMGIVDHIGKELGEIEGATNTTDRQKEWTDIVILGIDGLWREVTQANPHQSHDWIARLVVQRITDKQNENEVRTWPDWRGVSPDVAIEHDRTGE